MSSVITSTLFMTAKEEKETTFSIFASWGGVWMNHVESPLFVRAFQACSKGHGPGGTRARDGRKKKTIKKVASSVRFLSLLCHSFEGVVAIITSTDCPV